MARRRYRRRRRGSAASSILRDTTDIASALPWWGTLIFGVILFLIFYFGVPIWLEYQLAASENSRLKPALDALFSRRIHWFQWIAYACLFICSFFSFRNYFFKKSAGYEEKWFVRLVSRLLGRNID